MQRAEQGVIELFVTELAVKAFDEAILLRLSMRNIMLLDLCFITPLQDGVTGELGSIVAHNHFW